MVFAPTRAAVTLLGAGTQDGQSKQLQDSLRYIEKLRHAAQNLESRQGNIKTHTPEAIKEVLQDSWLVVECIPEKLPLKRDIIRQLDDIAPRDTIIASNSSSYSISEIIEGLDLKNDRRILSAHSYWPPETCAIEIMGHQNTDPSIVSELMDRCREHGFKPFAVQRDSTGYIYNRIWAAIKREALLAASEKVASPAEIDAIFKDVLKTEKGPFEQMDVVGLDVVLDIEEHYAAKRRDVPAEPREYLKELIKKGQLGVKSGQGFYDYHDDGM